MSLLKGYCLTVVHLKESGQSEWGLEILWLLTLKELGVFVFQQQIPRE